MIIEYVIGITFSFIDMYEKHKGNIIKVSKTDQWGTLLPKERDLIFSYQNTVRADERLEQNL